MGRPDPMELLRRLPMMPPRSARRCWVFLLAVLVTACGGGRGPLEACRDVGGSLALSGSDTASFVGVVSFRSEMTADDLQRVAAAGARVLGTFKGFPAVAVWAPYDAFDALTADPRVEWAYAWDDPALTPVVYFQSEVTEADREFLRALPVEVFYEFRGFPAVLVRVRAEHLPDVLEAFQANGRVERVEPPGQMDLFAC